MKSEQEIFWSGEFGDNYFERNSDHNMFYCFTKILFKYFLTLALQQ